jgi:hypothetical protein
MIVESEKKLEILLRNTVELKMEGKCLKLLSAHITGLPDRLCLFPGGKVLFVELKTSGKKPKKIQALIHNQLKALGFRVEVLDTTGSIKKVLQDYE